MWHWRGIYGDGSSIDSVNNAKYPDIDRTALTEFQLLHDDKVIEAIKVDKHKKVFCRRRVAKPIMGPGPEQVIWVLGWRRKRSRLEIFGRAIAYILQPWKWKSKRTDSRIEMRVSFVAPNGDIRVLDKFEEKHPWFYSIKFRPEEQMERKTPWL